MLPLFDDGDDDDDILSSLTLLRIIASTWPVLQLKISIIPHRQLSGITWCVDRLIVQHSLRLYPTEIQVSVDVGNGAGLHWQVELQHWRQCFRQELRCGHGTVAESVGKIATGQLEPVSLQVGQHELEGVLYRCVVRDVENLSCQSRVGFHSRICTHKCPGSVPDVGLLKHGLSIADL